MKARDPLRSSVAVAAAFITMALWPAADVLAARNIILFIGDGMGPDHVKAGRWFRNAPSVPLTFETLPFAGEAVTTLPGGDITDSATAGTALATGYQHPATGIISVDGAGAILETILEKAKALGYATGIVTTDDITGATPAAFGAHEQSRTQTAEIRQDYLVDEADAGDALHPASRPNVLMGGGYLADYATQAANLGYEVIADQAHLAALAGPHSMGLFAATTFTAEYLGPPAAQPTLAGMVARTIELLSGQGGSFFLMVEGALIDKLSHSNVAAGIGPEVDQFDLAVQTALAWRSGTPVPEDTLVLVTADHETGGLVVSDSGAVTFTTADHTVRNVGIYATWPATLQGQTIDNTETFFLMEDFLTSGRPPVPEAVATPDVTESSVRITWNTREPATSDLLRDGTLLSGDAARVSSHEVLLGGLEPSTTYTILVSSTDLAGNTGSAPLTFTTAAASEFVTLVPAGSSWKYQAAGTNLGTAWRGRTYNDSSWPAGAAPLGYGEGDEATLISRTSPVYPCYYFRHTFQVTDPNALHDLTLRLHRDDGAVVYLNGMEVARYGMPTGTIGYSTLATTSLGQYPWDPALVLPGTLLVPGTNVLAVEVHQCSSTSSDLRLDLELSATRREVATLVPAGSDWKYEASGADLGTAWRAAAYDDQAWPVGPAQMGYGDGDEATLIPKATPVHPCYYFRHTFHVADPAALSNVTLWLLRDDGAVVYLNGTEVARYSLPTGTVAYGTWATTATEYPWDLPVAIPRDLLVPGENVLAVEVHQCNSTSSDLSMDLLLNATGTAAPPARPVADPQELSLPEDTPTPILLTGSDPNNDPLTFRVTIPPAHGVLSGEPPALVYTPAANYTGPDSFTFVANDGTGDSEAATVSLTVTAVNDAPSANDQSVSLAEDTPTLLQLLGSDPEGSSLTYRITSAPAHGTLDGAPPALVYTPAANYAGPDSFTFVANDGALDSAAATMSIQVTAVNNDPPTAPLDLAATAGDGRVTLAWSPAIDPDAGSTLTYSIFRRIEGEPGYGDPIVTGLTDEGWVDEDVLNGVTYCYTVRCVDDTLLYADSGEVPAMPSGVDPDARVVQAPSISAGTVSGNFTATHNLDGAGQVLAEAIQGQAGVLNVQYLLHTAADPARIAGFTLRAVVTSAAWDDPWKVLIWNGTVWEDITTSIRASGMFVASNPGQYVDAAGDIRVAFRDGAAIRKETLNNLAVDLLMAEITVGQAPTEPPAAPAGLTARTVSASSIALAWTDNADNEQAYEVERSPDGLAWQQIAELPANAAAFSDAGLLPDTEYAYRVRAVNAAGVSAYTGVATARTSAEAPPAAPSNLVAKALPRQKISLTWTDNSIDETGFKVERSLDGATFAPLATVAGNTVTYTDSKLTIGMRYYYRVIAVRGTTTSAPSAAASAVALK